MQTFESWERQLNAVFGVIVEFEGNWRQRLESLTREVFAGQTSQELEQVVRVVDEARTAIERHIEVTHLRLDGRWTRLDRAAVDVWMTRSYPWMSRQNRRRALKQGQFDAWQADR